MRELSMVNGRVTAPLRTFECDGCGDTFDGYPEHLAEGLPFRTYCSDECATDDGVTL